jgi:hypothetical protein
MYLSSSLSDILSFSHLNNAAPQRKNSLFRSQCFNKELPSSSNSLFNVKKLNIKFIALGEVFAKQCHAVATQRLRRSFQILATYRRLYGEHTLKRLLDELGSSL